MAKLAKGSQRGGSRPGERRGGRQRGTPNRKTAAFLAEVEAGGVTPLDVLLRTMRGLWAMAEEAAEPQAAMTHRIAAAEVASKAAPYVHPRLAQVEARTEVDFTRNTVSAEPLP